jgi:zinc transport system permease protein
MFVKRFFEIMLVSVLVASLGTISGLVLSYLFDIPSGAAIIFFLVILFFVARMVRVVIK